ncbi:BTB/POZ and MATH domain-containing protein 2-like [Panicum virgatum]|uniref:BTB/POZ and MATH domain-containing protein 2-like n=1 Tax=Panicum virgatum TaxID=38727 RepID=UPI0019D624B3|nr:BTB/POZ and MATH domain-containing protein 2-like [Panicum virgatum]
MAAAAAAGGDVHVMFSLMMRDVRGGARCLTSGKVAAAFGRKGDACGYECFVSREHFVEFFKSGDHFAIRCECDLTVFPAGSRPELGASRRGVVVTLSSHSSPSGEKAPPPTPAPVNPSVGRPAPPRSSDGPRGQPPPEPPVLRARAPPLSGLHARIDLGRLLATKEGADVEFEVGGKIFAAHKSVLAARSAVFKEEFFGPTKEKDTSYVRISDMHPESFEALLNFMYTDSLPEMTMNSLKDGAVLAEDLLIAAGQYNLKDLKSLTENKLCSHVGVSTVLLMLAIAEQYQCCKLKKMCLGFISSRANAWAIMSTNDIENLARSSPSAVKDVIVEILDTRMARSKRLIKAF